MDNDRHIKIREAFLNLVADGELTFHYDGDEQDGRMVDCSRYRIEGNYSSLQDFCNALGVEPRYGETYEEAINRAVEAPPQTV